MFQRLLICTDLMDGLQRLTHFVSHLAKAEIQQITFLHCVPFEGREIPRTDVKKLDEARKLLTHNLETNPVGINVAIEVESGQPGDLISRIAKQYQADLIVMGMPIHDFLKEKLFGSTAMAICQQSRIPVMVFRPQLLSTYTAEELALRCEHIFRNVLIPYDDSDAARYLVGEIIQHQEHSPSALQACHLCWVVEDVKRRGLPVEYLVEPAQKKLNKVKSDLEAVGINTVAEVRQGDAEVEILKAAQMADISAIALASSTMGRFQEFSIPSFTREILRRSWHPIIYFPQLK